MNYVWIAFLLPFSFLLGSPEALYLTLLEDPSHSISIHWIEKPKEKSFEALLYRKDGDVEWKKMAFSSNRVFGRSPYVIKQCSLTDLQEDAEYFFSLVGDDEQYHFRTLPLDLNRPLKIAVGGDVYNALTLYRKMSRVVAKMAPDFVVLGGDIAYAAGSNSGRWITFLKEWHREMRGDKGRIIPMVALPGNHDVSSGDRDRKGEGSLFSQVFPFVKGVSYRTLDITKDLSFFLLDTGHIFPIVGDQTSWTESALRERKDTLWKVAVYHVAAYPSVYSASLESASLIRAHWVPLFEKYGVKCAFEHHNHAFKRTHSLKEGKIDPSGITYIGDGSWGVSPRKPIQNAFYLLKQEKINSFSLLTIDNQSLKVEAFDGEARLIDEWISK